MKFTELVKGITYSRIIGDADIDIGGLAYDSRSVCPGDLFICIQGFTENGHDYIRQALVRGAAAVVIEEGHEIPKQASCVLVVPDSRQALALLANNFYNEPSSKLKLIGVTGTN